MQHIDNYNLKKLLIDYKRTIKDALNNITKSGLGTCFVIKNKKLLNVLTDGDIRRSLLKGKNLNSKLDTVKIKKYFFVRENFNFLNLQKKLLKYKIVPILDKDNNVIDYADEKRFKQIPQSEPAFIGKELEYLTETIKSGWVSSTGKFINLFENKFIKFTKSKYALATNSGTAALELALSTLKLKRNDQVIVPDYTFAAPINSIIRTGAKPVLADVDYESLCMSFENIQKLINKKTKAIILVHLYGNTNELSKIIAFCKKRNIKIIEDCAEAFGTYYNKKHVGNFGDFGTFSFFGNKTITTGEGGMLLINDKKNFEIAKKIRNHGMNFKLKYWHDEIGSNYRMTNMQAALGLAQLENANKFIDKKIRIQKKFYNNLKKIKLIEFPKNNKKIKNSHWLSYFKIVPLKNNNVIRKKLIDYLSKKGIEARAGFFSAHLMKIYNNYKSSKLNYVNSLKANNSVITLPSSVNLKNKEINYISKHIIIFFNKKL